MKKVFLLSAMAGIMGATLLSSCSKSDNDNPGPGNGGEKNGTYVMITASEKWGAGYIGAFSGLPSGDVSNIGSKSLQVANVFGIRSYKSWVFTRSSTAGDAGLQKYTVNTNGGITDGGFISGAAQYLVVDDHTGYYQDENRGLLKLQTFDPSTMKRTGELDFSSLQKAGVEYEVIGKHILAAKEGKLYASITYGKTATAGYGDDLYNNVQFAVIDIATGQLEKTIQYDGIKGIGWGSSANKFWTAGDDGALYFYSSGFSNGITNSAIIRIKAGETDFDKTWIIKADDYQQGSTFATALVKGGKLYTELSSVPMKSDFSNLEDIVYDYYAIDLATKQHTKIAGMPQTHYVWANDQGIIEIDGTIYFWVENPGQKIAGYYALNGNTATQAFNVKDGGFLWGFVKLQ
ncbi:MAG TPA: hypothetical protein VFS25_02500 [Chitinophaga sp.]|uniref:hypothetical protein n=1 Tax=Chitinophaga sp. TaxID=1869181 RepID=UPI002DBB44E8|nr:hypothetical protein [Chitinophaga sp.]HEU4551668.1 hypothetical protein [Chitinophaga sp.]